jgi:NADP-dependent 3-hydroxy acid dehydrogenase YdfG
MSSNRVVAITGASAGIGRATALRLARSGAAIVACARRIDKLQAVVDEIIAGGGEAIAVAADVTREADMTRFVASALERFGRLDVMICNAGFGIYGTVDSVTADQMRELIDVNYLGTFYAIRAALPLFRRQTSGHVIVLSSIVGKRGVPYMGAYAATKFAQVGLAECLRAELDGSNIHVSVVFPISTETEFFDVMTKASGHSTRAMGPRQDPTAVADAIARAIVRPVAEVYPYRKARGLVLLNAIAPGFCDRLVKKWGRKPITAPDV